jgi:hypothetical protein
MQVSSTEESPGNVIYNGQATSETMLDVRELYYEPSLIQSLLENRPELMMP